MEGVAGRDDDPGDPSAGGVDRAAGGTLTEPQIRAERLDSPASSALLAELDADLARRYGGGEPVWADVAEFAPPKGLFLVAVDNGEPQACAGYRRLDDVTAELKRMYVRASARGTGLARWLLAELEAAAVAAGYTRMWLETGLPQPEAMALYISAGYEPIASFGQYKGAAIQRCFGKTLGSSSASSRAPLS